MNKSFLGVLLVGVVSFFSLIAGIQDVDVKNGVAASIVLPQKRKRPEPLNLCIILNLDCPVPTPKEENADHVVSPVITPKKKQ